MTTHGHSWMILAQNTFKRSYGWPHQLKIIQCWRCIMTTTTTTPTAKFRLHSSTATLCDYFAVSFGTICLQNGVFCPSFYIRFAACSMMSVAVLVCTHVQWFGHLPICVQVLVGLAFLIGVSGNLFFLESIRHVVTVVVFGLFQGSNFDCRTIHSFLAYYCATSRTMNRAGGRL